MRNLLLLIFILSIFPEIYGQLKKSELKEYFLDAEFFFAQEEYVDALYDYMELYNNGFRDNANINYRIGICYLNIPGQKDKAISYLTTAVNNASAKYKAGSFKETRAPVDAWLYLGNAYRINNQLNKAIEIYQKYKTLTKSADEIRYTDQQIAACNAAIEFMRNPVAVRKTNLGSPVNTNSSNFKAVISGDGKTLIYMTELPFYDAVYFSKFENGAWTEPINITSQLQSDGNQYVSCISYDGTVLYLTREDNFNSDIMVSRYDNGLWTKSVPVGGNINTKFWESHASVSKDGKTLYFASNRKGGPGAMDIFRSVLTSSGQWSEPVPLDKIVNTPLNEDTPFITENDSLLYFSSQGHLSIGGYDVFVSRLSPSGTWSEPENLGYPVNSTDDDLFYYPWKNGMIGYLALFEEGSAGKEDIYAIQPYSDKPYYELLVDLLTEKPVEIAETTPKEPFIQPSQTMQAKDTLMAKPIAARDTILSPAEKPAVEKPAEKMVQEILLSPVYFSFDNHQLSEEGKKELESFARLLKTMPNITAKLFGYTDAIGPAQYNLTLSEKRAISAMKYLISLGIDAKRISATGLGETNFAAVNKNADGTDNPEGRKLNRRVEFEIFGIDNEQVIIKRPIIPEHLKYKKE
jgi:outer membrane protein OmpA-like peptidoglycan-associated protein